MFFPQPALDQWILEGRIELSRAELILLAESRRYNIDEAVRVVTEVTGQPDPHGLVGKVKAKAELEGQGAEILETSMILGENAYDVVPGFVATPDGPWAAAKKPSGPATEEEMLLAFAAGK